MMLIDFSQETMSATQEIACALEVLVWIGALAWFQTSMDYQPKSPDELLKEWRKANGISENMWLWSNTQTPRTQEHKRVW
jgi:hypothetical protein